jgi:hypothetical protein
VRLPVGLVIPRSVSVSGLGQRQGSQAVVRAGKSTPALDPIRSPHNRLVNSWCSSRKLTAAWDASRCRHGRVWDYRTSWPGWGWSGSRCAGIYAERYCPPTRQARTSTGDGITEYLRAVALDLLQRGLAAVWRSRWRGPVPGGGSAMVPGRFWHQFDGGYRFVTARAWRSQPDPAHEGLAVLAVLVAQGPVPAGVTCVDGAGPAGPGLGQDDVRAGSLLAPPVARGPASFRAPALASGGRELLAASGAGYRDAIVTRRGSGCGRGCGDGRHRVPAPFAGLVVRRQPARGPVAEGRAVLVMCTGPLLIVPGS